MGMKAEETGGKLEGLYHLSCSLTTYGFVVLFKAARIHPNQTKPVSEAQYVSDRGK